MWWWGLQGTEGVCKIERRRLVDGEQERGVGGVDEKRERAWGTVRKVAGKGKLEHTDIRCTNAALGGE